MREFVITHVLCCLIVLCASSVSAEEKTQDTGPDRKNAVTLNLGLIPIGVYEAQYQRKLDDRFSIVVTALYYNTRAAFSRGLCYGYTFDVGFAPKVTLWGKALELAFYVQPKVHFGHAWHPKAKNPNFRANFLVRTGATIGLEWVSPIGLMLDANAGLDHYYFTGVKGTENIVRPVYAVALGYAW